MLGSKTILGPKSFGRKKNADPKNFGQKDILGPNFMLKHFCVAQIGALKKF